MLLKTHNRIEHFITAVFASVLTMVLLFTSLKCTEEQYVFGYNKDFEELSQQMYEVDSLLMLIHLHADSIDWEKLDSLNAEIYEN